MNHDYKPDNGPIMTRRGCCGKRAHKLEAYDWLSDLPHSIQQNDYVEVQFKNTRKGIFYNQEGLELKKGDMVAVDASPGHDIGMVSLTGNLVLRRMAALRMTPDPEQIRKLFRLARPSDMERYEEAKSREHETMIRSRQIAAELNLDMKIGDVEYQGDGNKAIFYYIADERVDFRKLIKVLAEAFHVRIEMKQIGARQEAGRIGGVGPCGRALCCASWMTAFRSVNTTAARIQDLTMNPQMLTGQCSKLKCCANFEVDVYLDAKRSLGVPNCALETEEGTYYLFKSDALARLVTYSKEEHAPVGLITVSVERAIEVERLNKQGQKPTTLIEGEESKGIDSKDILGDNSLTRFDGKRDSKPRKRARGPIAQNREDGRGDREDRQRRRNGRVASKEKVRENKPYNEKGNPGKENNHNSSNKSADGAKGNYREQARPRRNGNNYVQRERPAHRSSKEAKAENVSK